MPGPGQQHTLATRPKFFANCHHVGQRLTWMVHCGFEINDRYFGILCKGPEHRIRPLFFPIFQSRKRTHADCSAVATQYPNKLCDVLCLVRIHHRPIAMLERPTGSARLKDNCIATQFINTNLHRRSRAETGIEKDQSNGSSAEQVGACSDTLEVQRLLDESFKLLSRPLASR